MASFPLLGGNRHDALAVTLRVFHDKEITAPGVEYKSVVASVDTTAAEVIERVLERYGESRPARLFELHYMKEDDTGKRRKKSKSYETACLALLR